jgi:uncharacterized protein (DUF4415 family)
MRRKDASVAQSKSRTNALYELQKLQSDLTGAWLDKSLPDDWSGLDVLDPVERKKTRVTIRLDVDTVAWFRKLGPGYQSRINTVLRVYWTSLLAGHIQAYPHDDTLPRIVNEAARIQREIEAERLARLKRSQ